MSYTNNLISKPISITNIKTAISESSYALSILCKSDNINLWAKYKPHGTNGYYGVIKFPFSSWSTLKSYCNGGKNGWSYDKKSEEFKIGDFNNYKSNAKCIFNGVSSIDDEYARSDTFTVTLNTNSLTNYELSLSDLGINGSYFSVLLSNGTTNKTFSSEITLGSGGLSATVSLSGLDLGSWSIYPYITGNYTLPYASGQSFNLIKSWVTASNASSSYDDTNLTYSIQLKSNASKSKTFSNVTFSVLNSSYSVIGSRNNGQLTFSAGEEKTISGSIAISNTLLNLDVSTTYYYHVYDSGGGIDETGSLTVEDNRYYYVAKLSHKTWNDAPNAGGQGSHTYYIDIYKHWKKDGTEELYKSEVDEITFTYNFTSQNMSHSNYNSKYVNKYYSNSTYGIVNQQMTGQVDQSTLPYEYEIVATETSRTNAPYDGGNATVTYDILKRCIYHPSDTSEQSNDTKTFSHYFSATDSTTGDSYSTTEYYNGTYPINVTYYQDGKPSSGDGDSSLTLTYSPNPIDWRAGSTSSPSLSGTFSWVSGPADGCDVTLGSDGVITVNSSHLSAACELGVVKVVTSSGSATCTVSIK